MAPLQDGLHHSSFDEGTETTTPLSSSVRSRFVSSNLRRRHHRRRRRRQSIPSMQSSSNIMGAKLSTSSSNPLSSNSKSKMSSSKRSSSARTKSSSAAPTSKSAGSKVSKVIVENNHPTSSSSAGNSTENRLSSKSKSIPSTKTKKPSSSSSSSSSRRGASSSANKGVTVVPGEILPDTTNGSRDQRDDGHKKSSSSPSNCFATAGTVIGLGDGGSTDRSPDSKRQKASAAFPTDGDGLNNGFDAGVDDDDDASLILSGGTTSNGSGGCCSRLLSHPGFAAAASSSEAVDDRRDNNDEEEVIVDDVTDGGSNTSSNTSSSNSLQSFLRRPFFGYGGSTTTATAATVAAVAPLDSLQQLDIGRRGEALNVGSSAAGAGGAASGGAGKANLGHIGDGRRLGAQPRTTAVDGTVVDATDGAGKSLSPSSVLDDASVESDGCEDMDKDEVKEMPTEMPIQMLSAHSNATKKKKSTLALRSIDANVNGSTNGGAAAPAKRLSRELRGLLDDKENLPPTTTSTSNKKSSGKGSKPITRSKTRQLQNNLLQEHPSVRNKKGSSSSSKGGKSGRGKIGKGRAAQQAASPVPAAVGVVSSSSVVDEPAVLTINGYKVTMIDDERKVFVVDLVTPETCNKIRSMTDEYVRNVNESNPGKQTWRTLYTYTKMDLPCGEVTGLMDKVVNGVMADVIKVVGKVYGREKDAARLRPRSWKEPHLLHYQVLPNKPTHTGIEMHYDGCDVTWSLMLSESSEYEGGGTYIRCLRKTIMLKQGQILIHPGELYHKGNAITSGTRSMIVCFLDGMNPGLLDGSRACEDKEEYSLNRLYV